MDERREQLADLLGAVMPELRGSVEVEATIETLRLAAAGEQFDVKRTDDGLYSVSGWFSKGAVPAHEPMPYEEAMAFGIEALKDAVARDALTRAVREIVMPEDAG